VKSPRLLTNNPRKTAALQAFGLGEVTQVPLRAPVNEHSARYLSAKREKLGHQLDPIEQ
jgi:3,4-dihydroxy 2-butanone 4-phosphate synthase / GTP cyclohydrolase II